MRKLRLNDIKNIVHSKKVIKVELGFKPSQPNSRTCVLNHSEVILFISSSLSFSAGVQKIPPTSSPAITCQALYTLSHISCLRKNTTPCLSAAVCATRKYFLYPDLTSI